jgi:hypothetical protein
LLDMIYLLVKNVRALLLSRLDEIRLCLKSLICADLNGPLARDEECSDGFIRGAPDCATRTRDHAEQLSAIQSMREYATETN